MGKKSMTYRYLIKYKLHSWTKVWFQFRGPTPATGEAHEPSQCTLSAGSKPEKCGGSHQERRPAQNLCQN